VIFVTVGAQVPFDRLVHTVDRWAEQRDRTDVIAQVGATPRPPKHIQWHRHLDPATYRSLMHDADVIVTHAGMGTMLTAMEFARPVLVMPRQGALRETRNGHQNDTARAFRHHEGVSIAWDEDELRVVLDALDTLPATKRIASHASFELLSAVRDFVRPGATLPVEIDDATAPPPSFPLTPVPPPPATEERRRAA
jgi:UDP-N-acetylglucosamine transferase subunit ALG13